MGYDLIALHYMALFQLLPFLLSLHLPAHETLDY